MGGCSGRRGWLVWRHIGAALRPGVCKASFPWHDQLFGLHPATSRHSVGSAIQCGIYKIGIALSSHQFVGLFSGQAGQPRRLPTEAGLCGLTEASDPAIGADVVSVGAAALEAPLISGPDGRKDIRVDTRSVDRLDDLDHPPAAALVHPALPALLGGVPRPAKQLGSIPLPRNAKFTGLT
jgi:hypothetical protein